MKRICTSILVFGLMVLCCHKSVAQNVDTLSPVELHSRLPAAVAKSSTGVQEMDKKDLQTINSLSVADAVKYFSGVLVKDYGGIGGLKTISVRSLGANHTGVMLDGMMMADARAGVIDLGRLSTENLEYIRLYQSNSAEWVLPARSFASANLLVMAGSSAAGLKENSFRMSYKHGAFGLINPSAAFAGPLGKNTSFFLNGSYQKANGKYEFDNYDGYGKSERINTDVEQWRLEIDIPAVLRDSSVLKAKAYYYQSRRGLPGSVLLFNESANDRLFNTHLFGQITWKKDLSKRLRLLIGAKSLFDRQKYLDPDFLNNEGYLENDFYQTENYVSAALGYKLTGELRTSFSTDYFVNTLQRKDAFDAQFADPSRRNFLNNLSLTYERSRYEVSVNALHTQIKHHAKVGEGADDFEQIVPAVSFSVKPVKPLPVRIRAFYKEIFRAPTLDDLYYTFVGNHGLKPEYSKQFNVGLTWHSYHSDRFLRQLLVTADHYFIDVKDKIIALPRNNLFQWSMMNIGKAETRSFDIAVESEMYLLKGLDFNANISYSYQDAKDVTAPGTAAYGLQLAYVPRHSGSSRFRVERKNVSISWNTLFSSERYRVGDQVRDNLLEGYAIHDLHIGYTTKSTGNWNYHIAIELNNLLNKQYEIVKYFPMPGFNWRISFVVDKKVKLKK